MLTSPPALQQSIPSSDVLIVKVKRKNLEAAPAELNDKALELVTQESELPQSREIKRFRLVEPMEGILKTGIEKLNVKEGVASAAPSVVSKKLLFLKEIPESEFKTLLCAGLAEQKSKRLPIEVTAEEDAELFVIRSPAIKKPSLRKKFMHKKQSDEEDKDDSSNEELEEKLKKKAGQQRKINTKKMDNLREARLVNLQEASLLHKPKPSTPPSVLAEGKTEASHAGLLYCNERPLTKENLSTVLIRAKEAKTGVESEKTISYSEYAYYKYAFDSSRPEESLQNMYGADCSSGNYSSNNSEDQEDSNREDRPECDYPDSEDGVGDNSEDEAEECPETNEVMDK